MKDPVTPSMRAFVLHRDQYHCQAPAIDREAGICRDKWGSPITNWHGLDNGEKLTLHHIGDQAAMGKRAPSDPEHLLTLCWGHHLGMAAGANWATSHSPQIREYMRSHA